MYFTTIFKKVKCENPPCVFQRKRDASNPLPPLLPLPIGWNEDPEDLVVFILDHVGGPIYYLGQQERKHCCPLHLELSYWQVLLIHKLLWEEEINFYLHATIANLCLCNTG